MSILEHSDDEQFCGQDSLLRIKLLLR